MYGKLDFSRKIWLTFFLFYTVKNPVAELPGLPIFSVIFTRRLVRGFPTYQTLLEIM